MPMGVEECEEQKVAKIMSHFFKWQSDWQQAWAMVKQLEAQGDPISPQKIAEAKERYEVQERALVEYLDTHGRANELLVLTRLKELRNSAANAIGKRYVAAVPPPGKSRKLNKASCASTSGALATADEESDNERPVYRALSASMLATAAPTYRTLSAETPPHPSGNDNDGPVVYRTLSSPLATDALSTAVAITSDGCSSAPIKDAEAYDTLIALIEKRLNLC